MTGPEPHAAVSAPTDDGDCGHLPGALLPDATLTSSAGRCVRLGLLEGLTIIFVHPYLSEDDAPFPPGWASLPGAYGCALQARSFRDRHREIRRFGAKVFGLSTQSAVDLRREAESLGLPFELLSDRYLLLRNLLRLPILDTEVRATKVYKRVTLICRDNQIEHILYPVFPAERNAAEVLDWLSADALARDG